MGLLKKSECANITTLKKYIKKIKQSALDQFISIYKKYPNSRWPCNKSNLFWGYEVEFMMASEEYGDYKLVLGSEIILEKYQKEVEELEKMGKEPKNYILMQEYGRYMLEITPSQPFADNLNKSDRLTEKYDTENCHEITNDLFLEIDRILREINSFGLILTTYPILGYYENCLTFVNSKDNQIPRMFREKSNQSFLPTNEDYFSAGQLLQHDYIVDSKYFPFSAISQHKRFHGFSQSIIHNRGEKVHSKVLLKNPTKENDHIVIDSMGQGMGSSCLHVTFSINEPLDKITEVYDQMIPLTPLMLYLSRATAIIQGREVLSCHRWEHLCSSVDDRNQSSVSIHDKLITSPKIFSNLDYEKEGVPNSTEKILPKKPRCSSVDFYLNNENLNDINAVINLDAYHYLLQNGIPKGISRMLANEFAYDPILLYVDNMNDLDQVEEKISNKNINFFDLKKNKTEKEINTYEERNLTNFDDFQNIHSSNWRSLRLKIPVDGIWKIEFRVMEIQLTPFENSCFSVFIIVFLKVILKYKKDWRIPMSLVDINFSLSNNETFDKEKGIELEDILKNEALNFNNFFTKNENTFYYKKTEIKDFKTKYNHSNQKFFFKYQEKLGFGTLEDIFQEIYPLMIEVSEEMGPKTREKIDFMYKKITGEYKSNSQIIRKIFNEGLSINENNIIKANNFLLKEIKNLQLKDEKNSSYLQ